MNGSACLSQTMANLSVLLLPLVLFSWIIQLENISLCFSRQHYPDVFLLWTGKETVRCQHQVWWRKRKRKKKKHEEK